MVGTSDSIRKEIDAIETATDAVAEELQQLYQSYLKKLGAATKRQLVMTSFQLCTQAYPEAFLKLSPKQREQLQQQLQALAEQGQEQLLGLLGEADDWRTAPIDRMPPALMAALEKAQLAVKSEEEEEETPSPEAESEALDEADEGAADENSPSTAPSPQDTEEESMTDGPMTKAMLMNVVMEAIEANRAADGDEITPARLAQHYITIEREIRQILQELSKSVNFLLQEAKVLPNLPNAVLSAAAAAELPAERASSPNIVNVLIDMGDNRQEELANEVDEDEDGDEDDEGDDEDRDDEDNHSRTMAHLVALNLRLSDIEFADTRLSITRNQIRQTLSKLKRMAKQYQKKRRELSIAEAEAAWRSVWYDKNA